MSRKEYMEQLDMLLRDIPHTERQEALKYYEDYFEDAGAEHEADVIAELGAPEELAKKLREDLKREESEKKLAAEGETGNQIENQMDGEQKENVPSANSPAGNGPSADNQRADSSRVKKPRKGSKALTTCFIILGILIGIGHLCRLARNIVWAVWDVSDREPVEALTETYEAYGADGVRDLEIDAGFGELIVECWDEEEISVSYPKNYMKVKKEGEGLFLESKKRWWFSWWRWIGNWDNEDRSYQICIKIPRDYVFREVDISVGAGTASIDRLEASSLSLDAGAGELDVKEVIAAETAKIEAGVGESTIHNLQASEAELSIGVGELNISGKIDGDISVDCGVGDLVMELANQESDFNYDVSCGVGDVSINGKSYSGVGRNYTNDSNSAKYDFDISCGVGSITVTLTGME